MAQKRDYYEVLGLQRGASAEEVKRAYKKLARKFHPDMNPGNRAAEERFKELNEANEVLSDPEKKARYDRYGFAGLEPGFEPNAAGGFHSVHFGDGASFAFGDLGGLGDLFGSIFRGGFGGAGGSYREAPRREAAPTGVVNVSFAEAALGCEKSLRLERVEACSDCGGSGRRGAQTCPTCDGKGKVRRRKTVKLAVPAGIQSGDQLRAGDLTVTVQVQTPRNLSREQAELLRRFDALRRADAGRQSKRAG